MKQMHILGKDLAGLSAKELHQLEQQLIAGLSYVKERKEKVLLEQLELSRMQEQRALLENEALRRQVAELQGHLPPSDHSVRNYIKGYPIERNSERNGSSSLDDVYNNEYDKSDSDVTLQLASGRIRQTGRKETRRTTVHRHITQEAEERSH